MKRRVVVTGVGVASPIGLGAEEFWRALCAGENGIGRIRQFDPSGFACQIAGEAPAFKIAEFIPPSYRKAAKLMIRDTHLAAIAAHHAFKTARLGAGLISIDLDELAAAMLDSQREGGLDLSRWGAGGMERLTPLWLLKYLPNMLASHLTIIYGAIGASNTITACEASGHLAIGEAYRAIQRGDAEQALCGGAESKINPLGLARQSLLNRLNTKSNDSPSSAVRPFAKDAQGTVLGEGAAFLLLEELESARKRGAPIYAELTGFSASQEPSRDQNAPISFPAYRHAVRGALKEAGIAASQVDLLTPCGLGCPADDLAERTELEEVFGDRLRDLPLAIAKPQMGNLCAGNAVEAALTVLAVHHQALPPHIHIDATTKAPLTTPGDRPASLQSAVCSTHSLTGQNAALVFRRFGGA
jgi:3-oxoacyl-[acyl-carrier-protein] synthase II